MGFMDSVKKQAGIAKLQGELVLIDRQVTACKEKHGVAVYNVLAKRWHNNNANGNENTTNVDDLPLPGLQAAFQAATEDLLSLNHKRNELNDELEALASSSNSTANKGVSGFFTNTKLKTELAYYDREIKVRQGIFGRQLFDDLQLMSATEPFPQDDDHMVGEILNEARQDMQSVLKRKQDKQAEIEAAKAAEV